MADLAIKHREGPLDGEIAGASGVAIAPAAPAYRTVLRAAGDDLASLGKALGLELPTVPNTFASGLSGRVALWLGPDEWLIIDEKADPADDLKETGAVCAVTDVSHRNVGLKVAGRGARATLEAGCPRDLSESAFPIGACARTVLGKAEVVILRSGASSYRVECWRSFSEYVFSFLADAAGDCQA